MTMVLDGRMLFLTSRFHFIATLRTSADTAHYKIKKRRGLGNQKAHKRTDNL